MSFEKMLNWRQNTKKYKGRVVLRGDIVKDDSGSYAVFTEQGSSASQMTAAKIMDIISRQLKQNKIAKSFKKNYCDNNRIFVKFINKIL